MSLIGTTITFHVELFKGTGNGMPIATGLGCDLPGFTGIVSGGDVRSSSCNLSPLAFAAGDTGYVQVSASATGISLIQTVDLWVGVSLTGQ